MSAPPPYPVEGYARLADRLRALLGTRAELVFVLAEAIVALEAVASSVSAPGRRVLNIVTSPYGEVFGRWLRRGGSAVVDLPAEPGRPVSVAAVEARVRELRPELVALTHGEAASGIVNPLREIVGLARDHGALTVVDAVASVGAHELLLDEYGVDIAVIGPQKGLGGPASLSAVTASERAWRILDDSWAGPDSVLSLPALKRGWVDSGRKALPGTVDAAAFHAFDAAVAAVEAEGLAALVSRHARASRAARAGVSALGQEPWARSDGEASGLVTTAPIPPGADPEAFLAEAQRHDPTITAGVGAVAGRVVRLNHTAARAGLEAVRGAVLAYAAALRSAGVPADEDTADAATMSAFD